MRHAEEVVWAGGEHRFRLGIGELRAIEQASDAGVSVILLRLLGQQWKVDDVLGPIRLGLIGGGMKDTEAKQVIERVSGTNSLYELSTTAADLLRRFIMWTPEDAPGEPIAGEDQTQTRSQTVEPAGPATTEAAPSLGSRRRKSTK